MRRSTDVSEVIFDEADSPVEGLEQATLAIETNGHTENGMYSPHGWY